MTVTGTMLSDPLEIGKRAHEHESTSGLRCRDFLV